MGGAFWSEIPERGFLENLDKNLLFEECVQKPACASQIVSHILRMWRLTKHLRVLLHLNVSSLCVRQHSNPAHNRPHPPIPPQKKENTVEIHFFNGRKLDAEMNESGIRRWRIIEVGSTFVTFT